MTKTRKEFKAVITKDHCYLYPTPVIKDQKYLIEINPQLKDIFICALKNSIVESFDSLPSYLIKTGVHTDGKTSIFKIDYENIQLNLLPQRDKDLSKAEEIEKVLIARIKDYFKSPSEPAIKDRLVNTILKQRKCSTCDTLGINSIETSEFFNVLFN